MQEETLQTRNWCKQKNIRYTEDNPCCDQADPVNDKEDKLRDLLAKFFRKHRGNGKKDGKDQKNRHSFDKVKYYQYQRQTEYKPIIFVNFHF